MRFKDYYVNTRVSCRIIIYSGYKVINQSRNLYLVEVS